MFKTFANAWKIPELRKKILFTALIVLIFRVGSAIPVPFTNILIEGGNLVQDGSTFLNYLIMMTGDAFNYGTLFALSITPYINSSIIMQLLCVAIPPLERLAKEEDGQKKIASITRYVTVVLGIIQSVAYYFYIRSAGYLSKAADGSAYTGFAMVFQAIVIILCFTAGTALIMWLGEQINDKGIGNGISIILFAGIVSRIPALITQLFGGSGTGSYWSRGGVYYFLSPFVCVILILMVAFIVWMDNAERRIPVQYAKRVVGRRMMGGQSTYLPIKVNTAGVVPIIFASAVLYLPAQLAVFFPTVGWVQAVASALSTGWLNWVLSVLLIVAFAYFYSSMVFNPTETADQLRKQGGFIPGVRPGAATADYIKDCIDHVTLPGALFMAILAVVPTIIFWFTGNSLIQAFGGTSVLIMVGVAMDTLSSLESQLKMHNYDGFFK